MEQKEQRARTLIPSAFTLALLWKLYGFFNGLSEKLTRIETKIDGLKELAPYLIEEHPELGDKAGDGTKPPKHNPSIEKTDVAEIVDVGFGLSNLFIAFISFLQKFNSFESYASLVTFRAR